MALVGMYVDVTPKAKKMQTPYQAALPPITTASPAISPLAQSETIESSVEK
jgi:hypothetical protein